MHKLNLRLPVELVEDARQEAAALHVSLNTYILQAIANYIPYTRGHRERRQGKASPVPAAPASAEAMEYRPMAPRAPEAHGAQATGATGREVPKVGRKQPCPCGSGRLYGKCHGRE